MKTTPRAIVYAALLAVVFWTGMIVLAYLGKALETR